MGRICYAPSHRRTSTQKNTWIRCLKPIAVAQAAPRHRIPEAPTLPTAPDQRAALKASAMKLAQHCAKFRGADNRRAALQFFNTLVPFLAIVTAMFMTVQTHYWATLLLAIPGGCSWFGSSSSSTTADTARSFRRRPRIPGWDGR